MPPSALQDNLCSVGFGISNMLKFRFYVARGSFSTITKWVWLPCKLTLPLLNLLGQRLKGRIIQLLTPGLWEINRIMDISHDEQ